MHTIYPSVNLHDGFTGKSMGTPKVQIASKWGLVQSLVNATTWRRTTSPQQIKLHKSLNISSKRIQITLSSLPLGFRLEFKLPTLFLDPWRPCISPWTLKWQCILRTFSVGRLLQCIRPFAMSAALWTSLNNALAPNSLTLLVAFDPTPVVCHVNKSSV